MHHYTDTMHYALQYKYNISLLYHHYIHSHNIRNQYIALQYITLNYIIALVPLLHHYIHSPNHRQTIRSSSMQWYE